MGLVKCMGFRMCHQKNQREQSHSISLLLIMGRRLISIIPTMSVPLQDLIPILINPQDISNGLVQLKAIKSIRDEVSLQTSQEIKITTQSYTKGIFKPTKIYIVNGKAAIKATELLLRINLVGTTQFLQGLP